jgi:hypothetical protein
MLNVRFFCRGLEELSICPHPGHLTLLLVLVARDHVGPKTGADPGRFRGISARHCHERYPSPTGPRIKYRRELPGGCAMSDLTELGQEAIAAVSRGVADGAPCRQQEVPMRKLALLGARSSRTVLRSLQPSEAVNA